MSCCNIKLPAWWLLLLLIFNMSMYMYLYKNAFDGMVCRVVKGDFQTVLKDKVGSVSYYSKLMQKADKNIYTDASESGDTSSVDFLVQKLKGKILKKETEPMLTLFTTWIDNAEKYLVHNLTTANWLSLRPFVIPVVFTNETIVAAACRETGWDVFPIRKAAAEGIPVLKYMYRDVMNSYNTTFYAYSNSDILFTDSLVNTLAAVINSSTSMTKPIMIVGKRTNVGNVTKYDAASWENISRIAEKRGKLFTGDAEDFFITSRSYPWMEMADVVIGRRAYDNWLVLNSRKLKLNVIDATETLLAFHQTTQSGNYEGHFHKNEDYNHNLLVKMYKRIKYGAGVVECVEQFTKLENKQIHINKRNPKGCNV